MKAVLALVMMSLAFVARDAHAFEANQVQVTAIGSFNSGGHLWVTISGNNNCSVPRTYFIIQRWDNVAEPLATYRKQMYQLVVMALAAGKSIRVIGATCYLDAYLFADEITVYQ